MNQFILSGFSDEIDDRVTVQFKHLKKLGISYFEPRGINGKNISELSMAEAAALKNTMKDYGISASSIGSPIGKIMITDDFKPHLERFLHVLEIADMLESRYVRIFSFFIPQGTNPSDCRCEVIDRLGLMAQIAQQHNIILLHENEKEIYGDTAQRCADIFTSVSTPFLQAVFDPANFVQCGECTYPDAFGLLRPYIAYMHIKDAQKDGTVVPSGWGAGNIELILKELSRSGYRGFLSLEPHLGNFTGLKNLEQQDTMTKLAQSTPEKFSLAHQALEDILKRI